MGETRGSGEVGDRQIISPPKIRGRGGRVYVTDEMDIPQSRMRLKCLLFGQSLLFATHVQVTMFQFGINL